MRKFFYLFLTLCCIILLLEIAGKVYFDANYINSKIIKSLEKDNNVKVNIAGSTNFSLFYSPHISISKISLSSATNEELIANIDKVEISIKLSSLLQGQEEFDKLVIDSGYFRIHENKNFLFVSNIESILKHGFNSVSLNNSQITFGSSNNTIHLNNVKSNISTTDKQININSAFNIKNNYITSKISLNRENYSSEVIFQSGKSIININGNFLANEKNFNGEINSKIANIAMLKDIIGLVFPSTSFLDGLELKNSIEFTANVKFLDGKIDINKLVFKNSEISSDGNIIIAVNNDVDIDLLFSKIDYDSLFKKENDNYQSNIDFDFVPKNRNNVKTKINITEFIYASKSIKDIALDFSINNDHIEIYHFNALFPDQLILNILDVKQVEVDGVKNLTGLLMLKSNHINKNLEWLGLDKVIVFNQDDSQLQIISNLLMSKSTLAFNDIQIAINNQQVISGEYILDISDDSKNHNQAKLNINNMNFNDVYFPILATNIKNIIANSNSVSYLADFKMIRDISKKTDLDISINNSSIDKKNINKLYANIILHDSILDISNVNIDADFIKLDTGKLMIGAGSIKPILALQLIGDYLDLSFLSSLADNKASTNNDQLLNLFRFDIFEGYIYAALNKISWDSNIFHKNIIDTKLVDDKMLINNIQGHLSDNYFNIKGSYSFSQNIPIFSIGYAVNIVDVNNFLSKVFAIEKIASGTFEGSGSAVTYGKHKKDLLTNLEMNSSFTGKNIVINGIDIKNIINLSAKIILPGNKSVANYVHYNLQNGQTTINKISGDIAAANGVMKMNNVVFNSYYSNGAISMSMNLPSMLYNMISVLTFVPVAGAAPIDIKLQSSGTIYKNESKFDIKELLNYLELVYNK